VRNDPSDGRLLPAAWTLSAAGALAFACAIELAARQVIRESLVHALTGLPAPSATAVVTACAAVLLLAAAWLRSQRALGVSTVVGLALALSLTGGVALQQQLGARLGSDGFFYYAFLRSLVNDRDLDLANDYVLLGLSGSIVTARTVTGYAPTAWAVGPALAWMPFYAVGHLGARHLAGSGLPVATDGSSYPYRQAMCLAGLCYGLLGFWCCYRFAASFFAEHVAALATAALALGSFMTWYLVKEPTMSHATSMCVVAGFLLAWARMRGRRTAWQWALLGLLAGVMAATRWQNLLFTAFPAVEAVKAGVLARNAAERRATLVGPGVFAVAVLVGFGPQLAAWRAIYGSPFAVSPNSPEMFWTRPEIVRVLWSSRNGLFSSSPITYVAALGLVVSAVRARGAGWLPLAVFCVSIWVNASVEDWWGGTAYGARRFDSTIPLLVLGLAASMEALAGWVARRPMAPVAVLLGGLVLWNITAFGAALAGRFGGSMPQPFSEVSGVQARLAHRWFGYPFSYPANLAFAIRERVAPFRYDDFAFPMLEDPQRPYGRIDLGERDDSYVGDGWYQPESASDGASFRWSAARGELLVPLHHAAPVTAQLRVRPFSYPGASPTLIVGVNGRAFGPFPLTTEWQRVDFDTDVSDWRAGVNRVDLTWPGAQSPSRVKTGNDSRELGGMVDYVRIAVRP
jgi:hypothetical protein